MTGTDAVEAGHRHWVRRLTQAAAPEEDLIACGVWAVKHLDSRRVRTPWVERVAYTAGREATRGEAPAGSRLVAEHRALPAEAAHAVLVYGAARLQHPDTAAVLEGWLSRSPAALAAHHTLARRPPLVALDAWATWWTQPAALAYCAWGYAWDVMARHNEIAATVLLDAVSSGHHLGAVDGHTLSDPDRLLPRTTLAVTWHPHAHRVHALHGLALHRAGQRREARHAYRRSRQLRPI